MAAVVYNSLFLYTYDTAIKLCVLYILIKGMALEYKIYFLTITHQKSVYNIYESVKLWSKRN